MRYELNFLSDDDVALLRALIAAYKQGKLNPPVVTLPKHLSQPPEVFIAKIPDAGIEALTVSLTGADTPGSALCKVYQTLSPSNKLYELPVEEEVFNLSTSAITGSTAEEPLYFQIARDRYGKWILGASMSACLSMSSWLGYNPAVQQIPGHDASGVCQWYSTEECDSIADGITIDETPVTGGTNGDILYINGGLVDSITQAALDASLGTAAGAIADGTY